ncbi:MAG: HPr family phosphocarrier protein [Elusimicrobia bacterium]|nr:HPr family phosphocarrier protein [Elusimicrobiota bacterium]
MKERIFRIRNQLGLHARPAALFVQTANRFQSRIRVAKGEMEVNGKSVMGLMMLAAECGSEIKVFTEGADEESLLEELQKLFDRQFDEV